MKQFESLGTRNNMPSRHKRREGRKGEIERGGRERGRMRVEVGERETERGKEREGEGRGRGEREKV